MAGTVETQYTERGRIRQGKWRTFASA